MNNLIPRLTALSDAYAAIAEHDEHAKQIETDLQLAIKTIQTMTDALMLAREWLPYHEPSHPDYQGPQSDAGRAVRLALDPDCGCSPVAGPGPETPTTLALFEQPPSVPEPGSVWRHWATEAEYVVEGVLPLLISGALQNDAVVIYQRHGEAFASPTPDFLQEFAASGAVQ